MYQIKIVCYKKKFEFVTLIKFQKRFLKITFFK